MKYGFVMPPEDARETVQYAVEAEEHGWDGFFLSECMWSTDTWACLAGAAVRTESIRLGTLLTPLSTMRPWKLAAEAATVDQLSGGRVIVTVGMGAPDTGFAAWGEAVELKKRAELVDEGLDILQAFWRGEPFAYTGKHYQLEVDNFPMALPAPVQPGGVPVWIVGAWPRPRSMRRTLRVNGVVPYVVPVDEPGRPPSREDIRAIRDWLDSRDHPAEIIVEGKTPGDDPARAAEMMDAWEAAGATWWIESWWEDPADRLRRMRQGPPVLTA